MSADLYRTDPRWQEAHERLTAERSDESPDERMFRTVQAAFDLQAIERELFGATS